MEAYLHGVSTRKVDDLVKALGVDTGISKSEVSRICADLEEEVAAFRGRSLKDDAYPYVFLDATYCKARVNRRVVSQAVVVATAVRADGHREVLGFEVGDTEDGAFWTRVPPVVEGARPARGAAGISDAHKGLKPAIGAVFAGARGDGAGCTSCATCCPGPEGQRRMAPPRSAPSSPNPTPSTSTPSSTSSPGMLGKQFPVVESMLRTAPTTCSRSPLPRRALEEDLVHQPLRAGQQGDQTPHRRRRHFPHPEALLASPARPGRDPRRGPPPTAATYPRNSMKTLTATKEVATLRRTDGIVQTSKDPRGSQLHHAEGPPPTGRARKRRKGKRQ